MHFKEKAMNAAAEPAGFSNKDASIPFFVNSGDYRTHVVHKLNKSAIGDYRPEQASTLDSGTYQTIIEKSDDGIVIVQNERIIFNNPKFINISGYEAADLVNLKPGRLIHPDDRPQVCGFMESLTASPTQVSAPLVEFRLITKTGDVKWAQSSASYLKWRGESGIVIFLSDITERKEAEEALKASLRKKEVLLKEIHHRVKNNMQVVSSLLSLQADSVRNDEVLDALKESQSRVAAMALIHETLYQSDDFYELDLGRYTSCLMVCLENTYAASQRGIDIMVNINTAPIGMSKILPCGLILNELVCNALKHAFNDMRREQRGRIAIQADTGENGVLTLVVSDNGRGLSKNDEFVNASSLGLKLVRGLVENQLGGKIEITEDNGTRFTITFPVY